MLSDNTSVSRLKDRRIELALAVLAVAVYIVGIGWGLPEGTAPKRIRGWATDSIAPLGVLAELHDTVISPTANRWLAYPLGHHLLLALVFAPYLGWLWLTGGLANPTPEFPYGLADPAATLQNLDLLGRIVSVLMGAGIVVCHFRMARTLWGAATGVLTALIVMLLLPMVYYARTTNLEVPFLFWCSLGMLMYVHMLKCGVTPRRVLWLGIFAGIAAGTKDQAYGVFVGIPLVLWFALRSAPAEERVATGPLVLRGLIGFVPAFGLSSGLFLNPERYWAHLKWIASYNPSPPNWARLPGTLDGYLQLCVVVSRDLYDACGPAVLAAGLVGLLIVAFRDRVALLALVPALTYLLTVIVPLRRSMVRYTLPVALVICLLAARALMAGIRSRRPVRLSSWGLAGFICVSSLIIAGDLTWQAWFDSRQSAHEWLVETAVRETELPISRLSPTSRRCRRKRNPRLCLRGTRPYPSC